MKLQKLTYCLISLLLVANISFAQRLRITSPLPNEVSMMTRQAVIVNGNPGAKIVLFANNIPADTGVVRSDGVLDFINIPVQQGPVTFRVIVINDTFESDSVAMHISGEPNSIEFSTVAEELFADGRTKTKMSAVVKDKFGVPIPGMYYISLRSDTLSIIANDVDPNQDGIQVKIENGKINFEVLAPQTALISSIRASWGKVSAEKEFEFNTPILPLMLVGSANVSASVLSTSGDLSALKNKNSLESGFHSDGRLAFYGRGSVFGNYLLTASYDNTRRQKDRLFRELDPDLLYSIYGDNSKIDYTAQTSSPFFVKLEKNRSHILFGDFNTSLTQNELARYDRTFTGISGHYEDKLNKVDFFTTVTDRKVVQDEIRGQGISGYYFLGTSNVVAGSEKVRIETRDKRHNEIIVSRAEKSRFGDYEIDYIQGTLFFKQPVPSIDQNGNPVYIVVAYESQGGTATNYVVGGQAERELFDGMKLGVTAVTEERSPKNYSLLGANATYSIKQLLQISTEFANGSDVNNSGSAWKMEAAVTPIEKLQLKSYYRKVEDGFVNQTVGAGGASEIGSTKYGAGASYSDLFGARVFTDYYKLEQTAGNATVFVHSITGGIERKITDKATVILRGENLNYENQRTDTAITDSRTSTIVSAKTIYRVAERVNLTGEYEHSFNNSKGQDVKPSNGALGVEYRALDNLIFTVQQRFYIKNGNSTVFGVSSDVGYGTSVTGKYEIGNGISGQRNQASIGLKNVAKITNEITTNIQYERTRALDRNVAEAATNDNDALSLGLEYLPKEPYKATVKTEWAKGPQSIRRVFSFGGDIRLANDFTAIEKFTYFEESRKQSISGATFAEGTLSENQIGSSLPSGLLKKADNILGLAYRPSEFDWFNAIGKYEKKLEYNGVVAPSSAYNVDIISLHTFVEPVVGLEIGTKYALKHAKEEAFGLTATTFTDFYLIRAEYDLRWHNFDVAAEYRILNTRNSDQSGSGNAKSGYSTEIGYVAFTNLHIGVGYNFVGTTDRDLVNRNYWSAGPFVSLRAKFTEKIMNLFTK